MIRHDDELEQLARLDADARARHGIMPPEQGAAALLAALERKPPARPWWCGKCREPGAFRQHAYCGRCEAEDRAERWRDQIDRARSKLPALAAGAEFGATWLDERCGPEAVDLARAWADEPGGSLCLEGPSGPGKSALACAVLNWLIALGASGASADASRLAAGARFVLASELVAGVATHGLGKGDAPIVRDAIGATVLVLDDLGAEGLDPGKVIARVLQARYVAKRPTVITTGLQPDDVRRRYDEGVERRVFGGVVVSLRRDWRQDHLFPTNHSRGAT